ncbi:acylneuraminate cytidylyltransferase family protein [Azospirillum sp.]|uniref:acylneuraminate cytidylyltransferase family protein n=1 Tax=Azospirillum sp. TaxID=34012 RepID=UPI00260D113C|nr:acylneuraminate cytidylyltransferase family protein [Azospirillum sp.]
MSSERSSFLAIIPARGGSKGLPRKNILMLAGLPLIAHSIQAALGCPFVTRCAVTTDDPEIAETARGYGAEVVIRPPELATDAAPTHSAVSHALDALAAGQVLPSGLVLLQPTSPLRTACHLTECLDMYRASDAVSTVSVTEAEHHPLKSLTIDQGWLKPLFGPDHLERPRQELPRAYRPNGAIYALGIARFLETRAFFVPSVLPFEMPPEASVDIDGPLDLAVAELLLARTAASPRQSSPENQRPWPTCV